MNMLTAPTLSRPVDVPDMLSLVRQGIVAVASDDRTVVERLRPVCEFLELAMEVVPGAQDLSRVLRELRPMAVISAMDGADQDGFHAMKVIARHNRDLPIMLLTDGDPVLMGAADAVQDLWGLTSVTRTSGFPVAGQLIAFLFMAGRQAGCLRLVPI